MILDGLGLVLLAVSPTFLLPIFAGVWFDEDPLVLFEAYGVPFLFCAILGLVLRYLMREKYEQLRTPEAMALVSLGWLVIVFIGSIPYMAIGVVHHEIDAFFESMSGFTSTGATVLEGLDGMPHSILLWRALTQWLGGMGVIVLSVAVLSRFFGGRAKPLLMQAEIPGHRITRIAPRMVQTARLLWGIYTLFTLLEIGLLLVVSRFGHLHIGAFDAICHALTTLPGGGFGTHDANIGYWNSPAVEFIIVIFMLTGATSFVLHYKALRGNIRVYLHDPEFRFYILLVAFGVLFITGDLSVRGFYNLEESFRFGSFQVVSVLTTTGFTTANFDLWPVSSQVVLVLLMLMGGTLGSTSGALKMLRVLVILKGIRLLIMKSIHPHGVFHVKIGKVLVTDEQVANTTLYILLYLSIILVGVVSLTMTGVDAVSSISAVITCIGNVGPGLGVVGASTTFASLSTVAKLALSVIMWLGRLEILGCMLLFSPKALKE